MKNLLIKLICFFFPMKFLAFFVKHKYTQKHQFPPSTLIHRDNSKVLFEVEFNWYDHNLKPTSICREVKSGKMASIDFYELYEFKEFQGKDRSIGNSINGYGKEPR